LNARRASARSPHNARRGLTTCAGVGERLLPVTQWDDQSGQGNHALQGSSPEQATLQVAGSQQVLRFDSDDGYATPLILTLPCTIIAVYSVASAEELARRAVQGSENWLIGPYGPVYEFYNGGGFTGGSVSSIGQLAAHGSWQDGVTSRNWVNGAFVGSTLAEGTAPLTINIGAEGAFPEGLQGDLAEVLAYDSALSEPNLAAVWGYLAAKHSLS
jgi:hypothetical protein